MHWRKLPKKNRENGGKCREMGGNGGWGEMFCDLFGKMGKTWCETPHKKHFCLTGWGRGLVNGHHKGRKNGGKWGTMGANGGKWEKNPILPNFSKFPPLLPIFTYFPPSPPISPHFSLPWVRCGYVCGYITRHRRRVLLSPECVVCRFVATKPVTRSGIAILDLQSCPFYPPPPRGADAVLPFGPGTESPSGPAVLTDNGASNALQAHVA